MGRLLTKAIETAAQAHENQKRKASDVPYIVHPMEACAIASTMTDDEEVLAAAVLHDVVEDTDVTIEELERDFGERVAKLVLAESENKREGTPEEDTWEIRKQETLNFLREQADRDEKILVLGDKLANLRAINRDLQMRGDEIWEIFHEKDPKKQEWYYRGIADAIEDELGDELVYKEFAQLLDAVFK